MNQTFSLLNWAFRDLNTRKRMSISFLICMGIGWLNTISLLPAITWYKNLTFGFDTQLSFPPEVKFSVFIFGIGALLSSCLILQIGSAFIPALQCWTFGTVKERRSLWIATLSLTLIQTVVQAYFVGESLAEVAGIGSSDIIFICLFVFTTTLSVSFLLFLAHLIQKHGIGNGIALVFVSLNLKTVIIGALDLFKHSNSLSNSNITLLLAITVFGAAFYLARKVWHIDLHLNSKSPTTITLPFRPTVIGTTPIKIAGSVLFIPQMIALLSPSETTQNISILFETGWLYWVSKIFLMIIFSFLYTLLVFKPQRVQDLMTRFGYSSSTTGKTSFAEHLDHQMTKPIMVGVVFIFLVSCLQGVVRSYLGISFGIASLVLSFSIIMLGGIAADLCSQIEFYQKRSRFDIAAWSICDVAGDEWEATLKAGYLSSQGIVALIEPLRFSWGMPIRTIVDSYKIHVPTENAIATGHLLTNPKMG